MNPSSPFSPTQFTLIKVAAGVTFLLACWHGLKAFYPRWRRGEKVNFASLGMAVFLLIFGGLFTVVACDISIVARHPLMLPTLAAVGCLMGVIGAKVGEGQKRTPAKQPPMKSPATGSPAADLAMVRQAMWVAKILGVSLVGISLSLCGNLFGSLLKSFMPFVIIGFLLGMLVFFQSKQPLGARFRRVCPEGLRERLGRVHRFEASLFRMILTSGVCAFFSTFLLLATSIGAGGPGDDLPTFASRDRYVLSDHGKKTEVSRYRFLVTSGAAVFAQHAGPFFAASTALYALIFGRMPKQFSDPESG